ncbi:MAG: DDE-type integrase/transposase/recombinase [Parachlamydiaceae bacterium]
MSQLRNQLRKLLPRFSQEANKIRDEEARSRWMKLKKISESSKSLAQACRFFGMSEDAYIKWGKRLLKRPKAEALLSQSRKPHRSPNKTKPRVEKQVLKVRRVEPYLGPERISDTLEELFSIIVPPSTVYNILRRAKLVGAKLAKFLTKKHLKRYRRPLPGYLQMDFKYVPYLIEGKQYYQLSCVDHHSSWRFIRCYRNKNTFCVMKFLAELEKNCPFPIIEIQTDNDAAFTDKFNSGVGVTGCHALDLWCAAREITHRLIPVGVKELNGKVENTHKQDDREFFAMNVFTTFESLELSSKGYSQRWNEQRATRALGRKTPSQVLEEAYVRVLALFAFIQNDKNKAVYNLDSKGNAVMTIPKPKKPEQNKNRTRKPTAVEKYLAYLEWAEKKKLPALLTYPTMSQNFSDSL